METHILKYNGDQLLEIILEAVRDVIDFELAVILRLHRQDQLVVSKASGPLAGKEIDKFHIDLRKRGDIARLMNSNQPYLFDEEEEHIDTYEGVIDLPDGHSCLVAPLYVKDDPVGLMTFDHRACGKFTPSVVKFIGTVSGLIAIILAQYDSGKYLDGIRKHLIRERNILLGERSQTFDTLIGESTLWRGVIEQVKTVSPSDLPVLINGETGTGKERVAQAIHELSDRKDGPFIPLNCSALNAGLVESELFGHEKGAFTSAEGLRRGRFEMAHRGTLFLDEIADLPAEIQPKLLRTLQEGTFERVGGEKTLSSDVRIVAASNKDLREQVRSGRFREDLFYRLSVVPVNLPPLREREHDVLLLAEYFLSQLRNSRGYGDLYLSEEAVEGMLEYPWRGNVRELENIIKRAALFVRDGRIACRHLGLKSFADLVPRSLNEPNTPPAPDSAFPTLQQMEASHIAAGLERCRGKIYGEDGAAALLGLKPSTLQSRMKKLGIFR